MSPDRVQPGAMVTIAWNVTGADVVSIHPLPGRVEPSGRATLRLDTSTQFELIATNLHGERRAIARVEVVDPPPVTIRHFEVAPLIVHEDETVDVFWDLSNATFVSIRSSLGHVVYEGTDRSGLRSFRPERDLVVTLRAEGPRGSVTASRAVTVGRSPAILRFDVDPNVISSSEQAQVAWFVQGPADVSIVARGIDGSSLEISSGALEGTTFLYGSLGSQVLELLARNGRGEHREEVALFVRPPRDAEILEAQAFESGALGPGSELLARIITRHAVRLTAATALGETELDPTLPDSVIPLPDEDGEVRISAFGDAGSTTGTATIAFQISTASPRITEAVLRPGEDPGVDYVEVRAANADDIVVIDQTTWTLTPAIGGIARIVTTDRPTRLEVRADNRSGVARRYLVLR